MKQPCFNCLDRCNVQTNAGLMTAERRCCYKAPLEMRRAAISSFWGRSGALRRLIEGQTIAAARTLSARPRACQRTQAVRCGRARA